MRRASCRPSPRAAFIRRGSTVGAWAKRSRGICATAVRRPPRSPSAPRLVTGSSSGGSCDYFSEQYLCISSPAPNNAAGFQYARTGIAYCGFSLFTNFSPQFNNFREYLGGQLNDTLKQGHTYCVSFYVVKSDSGKYYTSNIGMYLSPNSSVDYSTALNLPYIPQIVNTNGIIYDTLNWTQISGNYVAGGGGNILSLVILIMMQIRLLTPIIKLIMLTLLFRIIT